VYWTETARQCLRKLPKPVRGGLLDKADELATCDDPRAAGIRKEHSRDDVYRLAMRIIDQGKSGIGPAND
jgi:mRNA-degrading endonuclease RelE of RelBE toxin-antitoxin system